MTQQNFAKDIQDNNLQKSSTGFGAQRQSMQPKKNNEPARPHFNGHAPARSGDASGGAFRGRGMSGFTSPVAGHQVGDAEESSDVKSFIVLSD